MPVLTRNRARVLVVGVVASVGLFVWWIERDRARHVDRPATTESHVAAARMALREIQTAQEIHAAEHDGRYSGSVDTLLALDAELALWLERGVTASLEAGDDGAWYAAEVAHQALGDWRCRVASDSAAAVLDGRLVAGEQSCDPAPDDAESPDAGP